MSNEEVKPNTEISTDVNSGLINAIENMQKTMIAGFNVINQKNPYEQAIIEGVINKGKQLSTEELGTELIEYVKQFINEQYGTLPKTIEVKVDDKKAKPIEGLFHEKMESILQLVSMDIPTMLVGQAGAGKNHTLEQVAEALGLDFYFANAITQEYALTGFIDANGTYQETQFYKAFTQGGLFFLDEIDASIPEALIILNSAIANKYFSFPNGKAKAHKDFRVVSAGNTYGKGASNEYVGRNQLDGATLDRFVIVEFDYDSNIERELAYNDTLYDFIVDVREAIEKTGTRHIVSMRAIINASKMHDSFSIKDIVKLAILKGVPKDELRLIFNNLNTPANIYALALKEVTK